MILSKQQKMRVMQNNSNKRKSTKTTNKYISLTKLRSQKQIRSLNSKIIRNQMKLLILLSAIMHSSTNEQPIPNKSTSTKRRKNIYFGSMFSQFLLMLFSFIIMRLKSCQLLRFDLIYLVLCFCRGHLLKGYYLLNRPKDCSQLQCSSNKHIISVYMVMK